MQEAIMQHTVPNHDAPNVLMEHQMELEKLYSKNQLMPRIKQEFTSCTEIDFTMLFTDNGIPIDFGYSLLVQMALHKRCDLPTLVGVLRSQCQYPQEVVEHIIKMMGLGLVTWNPVLRLFIVAITISDEVQGELDRYQFPLPMVVEPMEVKSNRDTGYMLNRGSIILKKNHHGDDVCLDHINRMNRVPMTVNHDTAMMVHNSWRDLDKAKDGESEQDFDKRKRAFEKYDRTAHEVIDKIIEHGNTFYFTHKYDKRGRTYCQGYHLSTQGTAWNKAICELADKEVVQL
jgi:hypothetical protein